MDFLTNPISTIKAIVVSLALAVLAGAGGAWFGWDARGDRLDVERANLIIEHEKILGELNDKIVAIDAEKQEQKEKADEANDRYHDALRASAVRMSVRTRAVEPQYPAASRVGEEARSEPDTTDAGGTVGGGASGVSRVEIDPEQAIRIDKIVNDGDNAIRDLNQCIDQYNEVRTRLNQTGS